MLICLTTTNEKEKAKEISSLLLNERLAACISITEVSSTYRWEGKIVEDKEFLLIIKTEKHLKEDLAQKLKEIHNYSVPEILFIEGEAFPPYGDWLKKEVK